jgi:hypothetical protein
MDMKIAKAGVLAVTVLAFGTNMATAAKISTDGHNPDQVQGKCTDTYFAPNANGVYGCLNSDGSGIVCGGEGSEKNTCYTWGASRRGPRHVLPTTQGEAAKFRKSAR